MEGHNLPSRDTSRALVVAMTMTFLNATTALAATNYEGMWWNPSESGWGLNLTHQGTSIFAVWFIYGPDGAPYWVTGQLSQTGATSSFAGNVYATNGTPYTSPAFDATSTRVAPVGTATATFTGANQLKLSYIINGVSQTKTLTRQTLTPIGLSASYKGYTFGVGPFDYDSTTFDVTAGSDGSFFLQQTSFFSGTCRFSGTYAQLGSRIAANGTYQCSDFTTGNWSTDDLTLFDGRYLLGSVTTGSSVRRFMASK
jgi:hypothetical protein